MMSESCMVIRIQKTIRRRVYRRWILCGGIVIIILVVRMREVHLLLLLLLEHVVVMMYLLLLKVHLVDVCHHVVWIGYWLCHQ